MATRDKLIIALVFITAVASLPINRIAPSIPFLIMIILIWAYSRLPWLYLLKRWLIVLPFVLVASVGLAYGTGIERFASLSIRAVCAATMLVLLTSTTQFNRLIVELCRWKVPALLISMLGFLYRYIFILSDEKERLDMGRNTREFSKSIRLAWKGRAYQIGSLFIRSQRRSEIIYKAMLSRGFRGEAHCPLAHKENGNAMFVLITCASIIFIRIAVHWRFA